MALDLTGFWGGTYSYPPAPGGYARGEPVPFDAEFRDRGGMLSGTITEPNTFSREPTAVLGAFVRGTVRGNLVAFDKTYDGGGAVHAVGYEGVLNEEGTVVVGRWRAGTLSGPFLMRRDPGRLLPARRSVGAER